MANGANYWDVDDKIKYFWARIDKRGEDECWPWMGPKDKQHGHGEFVHMGKSFSAHRVAWEIQNNQCLTRDMLVVQACGHILCCNKKHLFIKTRRKQQIEMVKKRSHSPTKLSVTQVLEIRRLFEAGHYSKKKLAEKFGVFPSTIYDVVHERTWNWVHTLDAQIKKV